MLREEDYQELFAIENPWRIERIERCTSPVYLSFFPEVHLYLSLKDNAFEKLSLETFDKGLVAGERVYLHSYVPKQGQRPSWACSEGALL